MRLGWSQYRSGTRTEPRGSWPMASRTPALPAAGEPAAGREWAAEAAGGGAGGAAAGAAAAAGAGGEWGGESGAESAAESAAESGAEPPSPQTSMSPEVATIPMARPGQLPGMSSAKSIGRLSSQETLSRLMEVRTEL